MNDAQTLVILDLPILINSKSIDKWCYYINITFINKKKLSNLKIGSFKTARLYTWDLTTKKILKYYENIIH